MANDETVEDRYGRNVRRFREERGVSQSELADRIGELGISLHPSAIAKIEARDAASPRSVRLNEAQAIADALDLDLRQLTGTARRISPEVVSAAKKVKSEWDRMLVRYLRDADEALNRAQGDMDRARKDVDELRLILDDEHRAEALDGEHQEEG